MRVLIVDDEQDARGRLRRLLAAFVDVEVVGSAADAHAALLRCAELQPDALFVDVHMPGPSGLDLATSLPDPAPAMVFVTAYDRFALAAFEVAAVDYLLKPVDPERLARSVERLRARQSPSRPSPRQLVIPERGQTRVVAVADILWLEAADNYVTVHTREVSLLMRRTLAGLATDLGRGFVRTHRSVAVALRHVTGVRQLERGDGVVLLQGGAVAPCSRLYRAELLERLARSAHP